MIKTRTILIFFAAILCFSNVFSQAWTYNFGATAGYYNQDVVSTTFMPLAEESGGTPMVYAASAAHEGGIHLNNPGLTELGHESELKIVSSPGASANKFCVYGYQSSKLLHTTFEILVGNQDGQGYANDGELYFYQGQGVVFSGTSSFSGSVSQSFVNLRWLPGSNGSVMLQSFQGNSWTSIPGFVSSGLQQGIVYTVEIFGNNGFEYQSYYKNGFYELAPGRWSLWINGSLWATSLRSGGLPSGTQIDSWGFSGERAGSSGASVFIDNVSYSGQLPLGPSDPLPVELLSFTAKATVNQVALEWITASETNNNYFTVERSSDALDFAEVAKIRGAAYSNRMIAYCYTDYDVQAGIWYYRIRQTDFDGAFSHSPVVAVNVKPRVDTNRIKEFSVQHDRISFVYAGNSTVLGLKISNAAGALVISARQSLSKESTITLSIPDVRPGIYFLTVTDESGSESHCFYLK
jgi:hypothetical protein